MSVGATRLFFGAPSSRSDSLVSLFPSTLPLTELGRLMMPDDMGVWGGVVQGSPLKEAFAAATLGTLPNVGVGSLPIACDDSVKTDDIELDRVGLGGGGAAGEVAAGSVVVGFLSSNDGGAEMAVGVGTGVDWAEPAVDIGASKG